MLIEVKVPQLSESVAEATLSAWHVKEGDAVGRDQNLIDIEIDGFPSSSRTRNGRYQVQYPAMLPEKENRNP